MSRMVTEVIDRATAGMLVAVIAAVLALVLPWWTGTPTPGPTVYGEVGPFDGGVLADAWEANLVGILAVLALLGFVVGVLVLAGHLTVHPAWEIRVPPLVYGAGLGLLVGLVYAAVAFGGDGPGRGWFAGIAAALLGPLSAWDARRRGVLTGKEGDPRPGPGQSRA